MRRSDLDGKKKAPKKKKKPTKGKIVTWGYQARNLPDVCSVCSEHGVNLIVDVRRSPYSQQPVWNRELLIRELDGNGVPKYISMPGLGNYNTMSGWVPGPEEILVPALEQLDAAMEMCLAVMLMCREREHLICHRKDVADLVRERTGCDVVHLGGKHGPAKKGEQMSMLEMMGLE